MFRFCDDLAPRWTNGGELASRNEHTGHDSRGRRIWCRFRRHIIRYAAAGQPTPTVELTVQTIGQSVSELQAALAIRT